MNNVRSLYPPLFNRITSGGSSEIREKIAEIDSQITNISGEIESIDDVLERLTEFTSNESLYGTINGVNVYVKIYSQTGIYYSANTHNIIDATFNNNLVFVCGNYHYQGGASRLIIDGTKILKVDPQVGLYYETSTAIGNSSDTVDAVFIVFYTK